MAACWADTTSFACWKVELASKATNSLSLLHRSGSKFLPGTLTTVGNLDTTEALYTEFTASAAIQERPMQHPRLSKHCCQHQNFAVRCSRASRPADTFIVPKADCDPTGPLMKWQHAELTHLPHLDLRKGSLKPNRQEWEHLTPQQASRGWGHAGLSFKKNLKKDLFIGKRVRYIPKQKIQKYF